MEPEQVEFEGTWEEVAAHTPYLAGRRVRLTILPEHPETATLAEEEQTLEEQSSAATVSEGLAWRLLRCPWDVCSRAHP